MNIDHSKYYVTIPIRRDHGLPPISYCPNPEVPPRNKEEEREGSVAQTKRLSDIALPFYNKKHGSKYELVEGVNSNAFISGYICFHVNFKAKEKSVSGEEKPTKLFFAELKCEKSNYEVQACRILDGHKQIEGCLNCNGGILHPTSGFQKGRYARDEERVSSLRKRSRNS